MSRTTDRAGISRRAFLSRTLRGLALIAMAGPTGWLPREGSASTDLPSGGPPLITRVERPFDAETPVPAFTSYLTPNHLFFVRSHFGPPLAEAVAESTWKLRVGGLVERPIEFTLSQLRRMESVSLTAVVQCSGNGRAFQRPNVPGVQWERGAVGNAQWIGVRLRDVLAKAGVKAQAHHVQLRGADRPVVSQTPLFVRSIPIEKALHPDTLLATHMNGEPLPLLHGAPLRLITPGWMADSCVKWLTDLTVQTEEAKGYYMETAYRYPQQPVSPGESVPASAMKPVEEMVVKSLIVSPTQEAVLKPGLVMVRGVAWTGEGRIARVEVSTDEGATWRQARLTGTDRPYAWRQWECEWTPDRPQTVTILSRATDDRGNMQPVTSPWNPGGFLWNGMDRVNVRVEGDTP